MLWIRLSYLYLYWYGRRGDFVWWLPSPGGIEGRAGVIHLFLRLAEIANLQQLLDLVICVYGHFNGADKPYLRPTSVNYKSINHQHQRPLLALSTLLIFKNGLYSPSRCACASVQVAELFGTRHIIIPQVRAFLTPPKEKNALRLAS